jgi:hypothetical protein
VQEISSADAVAEGVLDPDPLRAATARHDVYDGRAHPDGPAARDCVRALWDSLNAKRGYSWDSNPWVWVLSFRTVTP